MNNLRKYGSKPFTIVVVHGGPGASGEMAPVAKEISKSMGVLEPLQTKDSIDGQIEELRKTIIDNSNTPVLLIGWSWGAWLSLMLAATYPKIVRKLIIVGSGPFQSKYAAQIMNTRMSRLNKNEISRVKELKKILSKPESVNNNDILEEFGSIFKRTDNYSKIVVKNQKNKINLNIYQKVWSEAEKLRKSGKLINYIKCVKCPIIAIHGSYDPHPVDGVRLPLIKNNHNFKMIVLDKCGHKPWIEKYAKKRFYEIISQE